MEGYRDTRNECKRKPYTYGIFCASQIIDIRSNGNIKGKILIKLFKSYPAFKRKPYWGNYFLNPWILFSTIGLGETKIRKYVKYQEEKERREERDQQEFGLF